MTSAKTALLLIFETSSKSIAFTLVFASRDQTKTAFEKYRFYACFRLSRPNENRITLAVLSRLKEDLIDNSVILSRNACRSVFEGSKNTAWFMRCFGGGA